MTDETGPTYRFTLFALLLSGIPIGLTLGGIMPVIALQLMDRDLPNWFIGVNSAMGPAGVLLITPFIPRIAHHIGAFWAVVGGLMLAAIGLAAFAFFDPLPGWLVLRFLFGIGLAFGWVVSESWLNAVVQDHHRARVMALFSIAISLGFAAGPLLPRFLGHDGGAPFLAAGAGIILSLIPLIFIRKLQPEISTKDQPRILGLVKTSPTIFAAAALAGLLDSVALTFLPVYAVHQGIIPDAALSLTVAFIAGGLILQFPLGWAGDRMNRTKLLLMSGAVCVIAPLCLNTFFENVPARIATVLIWGGVVSAVYTLAMTMLGQRFEKAHLASATAGCVITFQIANLIGPPASGFAMDLQDPEGFTWFLAMASSLFLITGLFRQLRRKSQDHTTENSG